MKTLFWKLNSSPTFTLNCELNFRSFSSLMYQDGIDNNLSSLFLARFSLSTCSGRNFVWKEEKFLFKAVKKSFTLKRRNHQYMHINIHKYLHITKLLNWIFLFPSGKFTQKMCQTFLFFGVLIFWRGFVKDVVSGCRLIVFLVGFR